MTTRQEVAGQKHDIYPARYFSASPTYNRWIRLTCADVEALQEVPGFEGQHTLFYHNHPIRFIRLTGLIISITDLSPKFTLLSLDDSSGHVIEIKVTRIAPELANSPECPTNTSVPNLHIASTLGVFDLFVDGTLLAIGTVVTANGIICEFRGMRQLDLKRIKIRHTSAEESQVWTEMAKFKREVLDKPWVLGVADRKKVDVQAAAEQEEEGRQRRKLAEYNKRKAERARAREEKMAEREEKYERRRMMEEKEMNEGALL